MIMMLMMNNFDDDDDDNVDDDDDVNYGYHHEYLTVSPSLISRYVQHGTYPNSLQ